MQLKLYENIKRFRKEKGMTQEELAEILGVTVGAVSKWENGNNTPDIVMLTILADFFDISVDVLLGYDISSKKVTNIVDRVITLTTRHDFERAESVTRDALSRYPNNFTIVYTAAKMYHVKAVECKDIESAKESVLLFEKAKDLLDQNEDPGVNEFTIDNMIATDYLFFDKDKALETFGKNNFGGVNDPIISLIYLEEANINESLNYSTDGMISNLFGLITSSTYMILSLAGIGKRDKYLEALTLADSTLEMIRSYKNSEVGYFNKYEALLLVLKSYLYAVLKDDKMMQHCVKMGKEIALKYDASASNDVAGNFRFYHNQRRSFVAVDSIGESAINGIAETLNERFISLPGLDKNILKQIKDLWISA